MGNFFANYQVQTESQPAVVVAVRKIAAGRAVVSACKEDWITVFDENSESQDENELRRVAKELSSQLATTVFAFLIHDGDFMIYFLYKAGELRDEYNSRPHYFRNVDEATCRRARGNAVEVARLCSQQNSVVKIEKILAESAPADAMAGLSQLAAVIGIDERLSLMGFNDYEDEIAENSAFKRGFKRVKGTGRSAEDQRPKTFFEIARFGDLAGVKAAISGGADPNQVRDEDGWTALALAADAREAEVVDFLLSVGANPNEGRHSALKAAIYRLLPDLALRLIDAGADVNHEGGGSLIAAAHYGYADLVTILIERGASVNVGADDFPPIVAAAGKFELVEILLDAGADPNARTKAGVTALMIASVHRNARSVKLLLEAGADVNALNTGGISAMDLATIPVRNDIVNGIQVDPAGSEETVRLLSEAGAKSR